MRCARCCRWLGQIKAVVASALPASPSTLPPSSPRITVAHEVLFEDFRWFGAVLNQHVAEPWGIEELNDTNVRGIEAPDVGRRYQVYYNACRMRIRHWPTSEIV